MLKKIWLPILLMNNLLGDCGCDPKEEIEKFPIQPNPAFWTGYQSNCPYCL